MEKSCVKEKQIRNSQEVRRRSSRLKQKRNSQEERRSKITDLPDPLLCHILSYLSTKDSVRSSVLSKRWRSLWLQVPVLDLDSDQFGNDVVEFVGFVDRFLKSDGKNLDLNRFKLVYYYEDECSTDDSSTFESWMDVLARRRVRYLDFQVKSDDNELVCMPSSLYSCTTLVNLNLYHVALADTEAVVSLPCLKIMHLDRVRYDEELMLETLITSCPVLEKLSIVRDPFEVLERVCVRSPSLKSFTLVIDSHCEEEHVIDNHAVEIDAPRLEYMCLRDHFSRSIVIHRIAPSPVVNIDVNFGVESLDQDEDDDDDDDDDYDDDDDSKRTMIHNFFTEISIVSDMIISSTTLEVIHDYLKLELLPQFSNLSWLYASSLGLESLGESLPTFLGCCPNLHTLVLEFEVVSEGEPTKLSYVPPCFVSSLKFVELRTPVTTRSSSQMKLARYFLRNCAALKELALSESFGDTIKEIKRIRRKSRKCNIVISSSTTSRMNPT